MVRRGAPAGSGFVDVGLQDEVERNSGLWGGEADGPGDVSNGDVRGAGFGG